MEYEIGIGKTGRRAYGFDEVAIVPSRRTRDPDDVDISWEIDAYTFALPMMASAMDARRLARHGDRGRARSAGSACLNLEGLQTRYEDPEPIFDEIAALPDEKATRRMQELYEEPVKPELIGRSGSARSRTPASRRQRLAHATAGRPSTPSSCSRPSSTSW